MLAFLAIRILTKRGLLRIFQVPGMVMLPLVFLGPALTDLTMLKYGIFLVGLLTVAQFSFWGNYLPLVHPTHLRGTGEAFAANVGGRADRHVRGARHDDPRQLDARRRPGRQLAYAAAVVGAIGVRHRLHRQLLAAGAEGRSAAGLIARGGSAATDGLTVVGTQLQLHWLFETIA